MYSYVWIYKILRRDFNNYLFHKLEDSVRFRAQEKYSDISRFFLAQVTFEFTYNFAQERCIIVDKRRIVVPDLLQDTLRESSSRCWRADGDVLMRNEGIIKPLAGGRVPGPTCVWMCAHHHHSLFKYIKY